MAQLMEYKCPNCGGAVEFSSKLQKMQCPYCDSEFDIQALQDRDKELENAQPVGDMEWDTNAGGEWQTGETDGMLVYACRSCGGEIVGDETTAATSCPYCGNPVVIKGQFAGELKPDLIIPFKLDKKAAKEGLMQHMADKKLLPSIFKDQNHIDEIKGVYVPFWLFDADVDAHITYKAATDRTWNEGNYRCTETSYFNVVRDGSMKFRNVPVDGSKKMDDELMESIEPYDFSDMVDFQTAYLAGYLADKYDVNAEECKERANERIIDSTETAFRNSVNGGYHSVEEESRMINMSNGKAKYALLPVWLLSTSWNGENYLFAMNGQTGKFVGDLPMDKKKYWIWSAIYALGIGLAIYLIVWLFR